MAPRRAYTPRAPLQSTRCIADTPSRRPAPPFPGAATVARFRYPVKNTPPPGSRCRRCATEARRTQTGCRRRVPRARARGPACGPAVCTRRGARSMLKSRTWSRRIVQIGARVGLVAGIGRMNFQARIPTRDRTRVLSNSGGGARGRGRIQTRTVARKRRIRGRDRAEKVRVEQRKVQKLDRHVRDFIAIFVLESILTNYCFGINLGKFLAC